LFTCLKVAKDLSHSCTTEPTFPNLNLIPNLRSARETSNNLRQRMGEQAADKTAAFEPACPQQCRVWQTFY